MNRRQRRMKIRHLGKTSRNNQMVRIDNPTGRFGELSKDVFHRTIREINEDYSVWRRKGMGVTNTETGEKTYLEFVIHRDDLLSMNVLSHGDSDGFIEPMSQVVVRYINGEIDSHQEELDSVIDMLGGFLSHPILVHRWLGDEGNELDLSRMFVFCDFGMECKGDYNGVVVFQVTSNGGDMYETINEEDLRKV